MAVVVAASAIVVGFAVRPAFAAMTVSPNTNLPSTANVNVSGTGFAANQPGTLRECKFNPGLGVDECKDIGMFPTSPVGNFGPAPVTVTRTYVSSANTNVDCNFDLANPCRVLAELNNVFGQQEAPIFFAGGYPLPVSAAVPANPVPATPTAALVLTEKGRPFPAAAVMFAGMLLVQVALVIRARAQPRA